jgi:cobalt-zinc-cadmium efflux system membrane fusion protein
MKRILALFSLLLFAPSPIGADEHAHGEGAEHADESRASGAELLHIEPQALRDLRLTTSPVELRSGAEAIVLLGQIRVDANAYAEVGPAIAGRLLGLFADVGERVEAGAPLAALESVELGNARAALVASRARAAAARKAAERTRALERERIAPEREAERTAAGAAAAEAELEAARAALQALGVSEEVDGVAGTRFTLRAPLAGTVLERDAVLGRMVSPETALFRIGDLSRVWLVAQAFEREAMRIAPETAVRVELAALPERIFEGRVALVGRVVDPLSRTVAVRIALDNPEELLRPGMTARARVEGGGGPDVLAVPAAAAQRVEGGWVVFVPRGPSTFEIRPVGRGRDLSGETEILSGLAAGEEVVVDGAFLLKAEVEKAHGAGEHHHH